MLRTIRIFLVLVCFFIAAVGAARAECVIVSPPCAVYDSTPVLFLGKVLSISRSNDWPWVVSVRVRVLEVLKGLDAGTTETVVVMRGDFAEAYYSFAVAKTYVVFTQRNQQSGEIVTSVCSNTYAVEDPANDFNLRFMRGLKNGNGTAAIFVWPCVSLPACRRGC